MWITLAFILGLFILCVGSGMLWAVSNIMSDTINDYNRLAAAERKLYRDVGDKIRRKNIRLANAILEATINDFVNTFNRKLNER